MSSLRKTEYHHLGCPLRHSTWEEKIGGGRENGGGERQKVKTRVGETEGSEPCTEKKAWAMEKGKGMKGMCKEKIQIKREEMCWRLEDKRCEGGQRDRRN